jgi:hypothetical protein
MQGGRTPRSAGAPASAWPASHIRGALATIYGGGSKARNEDGTPRTKFRSLQHEILATLDGKQVFSIPLSSMMHPRVHAWRSCRQHVQHFGERAWLAREK